MKIKIAGIRRSDLYSPNNIDKDAAIFDSTVEQLKKKGCEVAEYSEEEFQQTAIEADLIFTMARNPKSVRKLQQLEDTGIKVVNSGYGIDNCTREKMIRLLSANHIPQPESIIIRTDGFLPERVPPLEISCWIKRGDFHAIYSEDVVYVAAGGEVESILRTFALRGIPSAVITEHLEGDIIKFYGIEGTDFFHWFYPKNLNHSKFGMEKRSEETVGYPFEPELLKNYCSQTARILNIHIYGGDGVVDKDGKVQIIDFNDWPSFALCRKVAAQAIAGFIENLLL